MEQQKNQNQNPIKNPEGYTDTTPYKAIKELEAEEYKARKCFETILHVARLAGFHLEGDITLTTRSGRIYNGWELKEKHRQAKLKYMQSEQEE